MIAIFKREIRNYLKRPLFWVGVLLVIYGVFNATSPYLTTHYLTTGEEIINDQSNTSVEGEVYEGYIPATPEKHREVWHEKVKIKLTDVFGLTDSEAQNVIEKLESMNLKEAYAYLEQEYDWYGARYLYEDSTYYKGTAEEINAYLDKKLEDKTFSFYYARKFADFAGLYMVFFAIIMLAVLFLQDTKKHTYELLHTKPVTAGKYVMGKVSAGFTICLLVLTILNILFWVLCRIYTKDSGFEVRLWDFVASTVLYILPNMLMIVSIYTLISLIFKNPLPGVPLLILYMVYSNLGGRIHSLLITISSSSRRSLKSLQCEEANSYILSMSTAPVISPLLMITRIFVPSSSTAKRSSSNSISGSFLRIESVASNLTSSITLSSLPASKIWIFSTS